MTLAAIAGMLVRVEQPSNRLSVVFFGRRSLLSASVLESVARTHRVVAIVESQPQGYRPAVGPIGRLRPFTRRVDLERFARRRNIPYLLLWADRIDQLSALIEQVKPDVGVIAVMLHLMPERIIAQFPQGVVNLHPTLLPNYRGPNPLFWTYYNQEKTTGVTAHFIDAGEDSGDIIRQVELPLAHGEHGRRLEERYAATAAEMIPGVLDDIARGTVTRTPQRHLPCPHRGRTLRKGEDPIEWATWPITRTYHVLCGIDGSLDLVPPRPFPWSMFEWSPASCSSDGGCPGEPRFVRSGLRFYVETPTGRVRLRPRFSLHLAKRAMVRLFRRPKPPSISPGRSSPGTQPH